MSEFEKTCTYCKEKIKLSDKQGGKWLPYNLDGSAHDCRPKPKPEPEKENTLTAKEIVDRLRSVGINLDLKLFLEKTKPNNGK